MNKKKLRVALSFLAVSSVLAWLLISGFDENMQYYVKVKELKATPTANLDKGLRVKGKLVSGSLVESTDNLQKVFWISENDDKLEVHYSGLLPDTFKDGAEILVEGKYISEGYFEAKTVMAKCPSKYESTETYDKQGYNSDSAQKSDGTF